MAMHPPDRRAVATRMAVVGTYIPATTDEIGEILADARNAWADFQELVATLKAGMRQHPDLVPQLERIEAYGALVGRDEGAGQSMEGWLDEIADELAIVASAESMEEGDAR